MTEGWHDIETAPKDGSRILTWNKDPHSFRTQPEILHWDGRRWAEDDGGWFVVAPQLWQPLPAPPVDGGSDGA